MLAPGTEAPDFTLPAHDGRTVRLEDLRGRWVLLWWYPKAATPG
jgi:peroxiredoxin Q/BCP